MKLAEWIDSKLNTLKYYQVGDEIKFLVDISAKKCNSCFVDEIDGDIYTIKSPGSVRQLVDVNGVGRISGVQRILWDEPT